MSITTTEITQCRLCCAPDLDLVLDYGPMPMAGGFAPRDDPRSDVTVPLRLGVCRGCGLMQVLDSVDPGALFAEYSYRSSVSPALKQHFGDLARSIDTIRKYVWSQIAIDRFRVVDIGCNDGVLIGHLASLGIEALGIDPSDVAARAAKEDGWILYNDYATPTLARAFVQEHGQAHVVTACNVLAHTDDMHAMVEAASILLKKNGVLIVEVQYQGDLLDKMQFDTVYHEHRSYFSLGNLVQLFAEHGLSVLQADHIPTHSGSIRVTVGHSDNPLLAPEVDLSGWWRETERHFDPYAFGANALRARRRIRTFLSALRPSQRVWAYGAAGRSTILLNWCALGSVDVRCVVDASPLRQGMVVPGTDIPIVSVEQFVGEREMTSPDFMLITAWNYADSIITQHPTYKGLWMIPLPEVRLI